LIHFYKRILECYSDTQSQSGWNLIKLLKVVKDVLEIMLMPVQ